MTQTNFKNSNAITPSDLDMEVEDFEIETEGDLSLQDWDETPKTPMNPAEPTPSFFGSKAHQITRNQLVELYRKVDALNRPDEEDLLDVLNEALRDELSSKRMEKAHVLDKAQDFENQAWEGYTQVLGQVQTDLNRVEAPAKEEETEKLGGQNPKFPDDSVPSRVDQTSKTAFYDMDSNVNLHTNYEDSVNTHDVTASGTVTLHGGNQKASFTVTYNDTEQKFVITEQGTDSKGKAVTETYKVDAESVTKIVFDAKKVDLTGLSPDQQKKIQIGTNSDAAKEALAVNWPTGKWAQFIPHSDHDGDAREAAGMMDRAMEGNGSWQTVLDNFNDKNSWDGNGAHAGDQNLNDIIRKLVTGLFRASEATDQKDPRFVKL